MFPTQLNVSTRPVTVRRIGVLFAAGNNLQVDQMKAVTFIPLLPTNHTMMLFYNESTGFMETWMIQLGNDKGRARFTKIVKSNLPEIWGYCACAHEDGKRVFLFGGWDGGGFCNGCWVFELEKKEWREIEVRGVGPSPRAHAAGKIAGEKLYIHGGHTDLGITNDLWCLNLDDLQWCSIPIAHTQISFSRHAMHIQANKLYIYGGDHGKDEFDTWDWHTELTDLYCLSLDQVSEGWQRIYSTPRHSTIFTSQHSLCGWNDVVFNLVTWGGRNKKSSLFARHPDGDWIEIEMAVRDQINLDPERGQASLSFKPFIPPTSPNTPGTPASLFLFGITKKYPVVYCFEPTSTLNSKPIFWANENWRSYFGNFFFSDVTIRFPEVTFVAQKMVLTRFSKEFFKKMLDGSFKEGRTNIIDIKDETPEIFRIFLKFCHGMLDLNHVEPQDSLSLLLLADRWSVEELSSAIHTAASTITQKHYYALVKAVVKSAEGYQPILMKYCAVPLLREPVLIELLGPDYTEMVLRYIYAQNVKQQYPTEGSEQLFLYAAAVFPGSEKLIRFVNETFKTRFSDASGQHRTIFQNYEIAEKYILTMVEKIFYDTKNSPCERFWLKLVRNLSSNEIYRRQLSSLSNAILRSALLFVGPMVPTKQPTLPQTWSRVAVLLRKFLQAIDLRDTVDMTMIIAGWSAPEIEIDQFLENPNFLSNLMQFYLNMMVYLEDKKIPLLVNYFFVRYLRLNYLTYARMGELDLKTLYKIVMENEYDRIVEENINVKNTIEELGVMMRFFDGC